MPSAPIPRDVPAGPGTGRGPERVVLTIPLRTVSEANAHEHWRARQGRAKQHRAVALHWLRQAAPLPAWPVRVAFTRLAPRKLDSDNLQSAIKHVRDGVADAYDVNDRDERWEWRYAQEHSKEYAVRIELESLRQTQPAPSPARGGAAGRTTAGGTEESHATE